MKKFNFIYLALALVGVISLTSCEHKYADFTPGAKDANLGVYFPSVDPIVVTAEDISVNIKVARLNTAGDAEVSVRYDDFESGIFTMPKSVLFAAGESEANILVQFDASEFTPGKQYPVLIQLDSTEASQYGVAENIFQIGIAEPCPISQPALWGPWGLCPVPPLWGVPHRLTRGPVLPPEQ